MTSSFFPPRRVLMGPGPSDVSPRVLAAMARPTIGHLDPAFIGLMDSIRELLQYAFQTRNRLTMALSAPGSAGMEACFVNLLEPGDKVIVCENGVFGARMRENVERCGAEAILLQSPWGQPVDLDAVASAFQRHDDIKALAFVHAETSTGVRSDARELCQLARNRGALSIVDTVTSLAGIDVDVDGWGADAVYSGSQKCLSCVPGISPITFSERAVDVMQQRSSKVQSWFLDMQLVMQYWQGEGKRSYHHTAPVNALYAVHEALLIVKEEGLQAAWQRHKRHHLALVAGLEALGLTLPVAENARLPQLNLVTIPAGVDDAAVRNRLLQDFSLEIGAGLGEFAGKAWRIGLMGHGCQRQNVLHCLSALEQVLPGVEIGQGVNAALASYH